MNEIYFVSHFSDFVPRGKNMFGYTNSFSPINFKKTTKITCKYTCKR